MSNLDKRLVFLYELAGMVIIIVLGSLLHFTFEASNHQPFVGVFSAVNESVWEHLKLGFWPALLYALLEYRPLKKSTNNFFLGKAVGISVIPIVITITFYAYTAVLEGNLVIDILTFIIAVIVGQLVSYKVLTSTKRSEKLQVISLVVLAVLALAFIIFTFVPPHHPLFQDPISGEYGITNHAF